MYKYQLTFFEKLIKQDLLQLIQSRPQPDKAFSAFTLSQVKEEKEQVLQNFAQYLFHLSDEKSVEWYIRMHQFRSVELIDLAAVYLSNEDMKNINNVTTANTWSDLCKHVYHNLSSILTFLEREFPRYLDTDCKIPISYLFLAQYNFARDLQFIEEECSRLGLNEQLSRIILQLFKGFNKLQADDIVTYHQLFYLRELMKRISILLRSTGVEANIDERIQDLFLYLNFNTYAYYSYCTESIAKEIDELPTREEKLDRLEWLQKRVNQTPAKPGFIYSRLHPGLHEQLKKWLTEEIRYLKQKEQFDRGGHLPGELARWKGFKVLTLLSVPQLGHMIRLLVDNSILVNTNKSELLDFFSFFFASTKQDNISAGSLRTNFYKDDASVAKAVRDILLLLVNHSRKGLPGRGLS